MSTFTELAALGQGTGFAYLLEGSRDNFSTIHYAYSTHDGLFGGSTAYDVRIVGLGDLQRGFGNDGVMAASTVSVTLSNIDAELDFLFERTNSLVKVFKIRWRLKIAIYDVSNPSDIATKTLGVFTNLDNPIRDAATVTLQLADDTFGYAAELAIPPTWGEALAGTINTETTEPPVPLAFGTGVFPAVPAPFATSDTSIPLVICATTDTSAVDAAEIDHLELNGPGLTQPIWLRKDATTRTSGGVGGGLEPLWVAAKTGSITKDGRTWKVLYVTLYVDNLRRWLFTERPDAFTSGEAWTGVAGETNIRPAPYTVDEFNQLVMPTLTFMAAGPKFSSRTYVSNVTPTIRAPDIAYDLLRYYSRGLGASDVSAASFAAASAAAPLFFFRSTYYFSNFTQSSEQVIGGGSGLGRQLGTGLSPSSKGALAKSISELCQGGFFDVVTDWSGQFVAYVLANSFNLQTASATVVDETQMGNIRDRIPSQGERWAPYNRVIFQKNGRIIDNITAISDWGVVLTRTINDSTTDIEPALTGTDFGLTSFGGLAVLESKVRPIISFDYPLDALNWELGGFLAVTWSRGASGVPAWSGSIFRIEAMTLHPEKGNISIEAVCIQDLVDSLPYLLDDETLLVRTKPVAAGLELYTAGGYTYAGSVGGVINFTTGMGLQPGDILVLRDSSQAADVFTRNRAIRIDGPDDDFSFYLDPTDSSGIPASPSTVVVANADWSIVRGATTYPTAVSDPTNYPSGGRMYGKQSESGTFSDSSAANVLQGG